MATYAVKGLSGSTNGKQIKLTTVATPGDLIHTAVAGTSDWDEIYIYCYNSGVSAVELTVEWGEHTAPDGNIKCTVPAKSGLQLVVPGLKLQNSMDVNAFAGSANVLMLSGWVNRITA
jgi:hypothetical protein